jgi:hypothetical protein
MRAEEEIVRNRTEAEFGGEQPSGAITAKPGLDAKGAPRVECQLSSRVERCGGPRSQKRDLGTLIFYLFRLGPPGFNWTSLHRGER